MQVLARAFGAHRLCRATAIVFRAGVSTQQYMLRIATAMTRHAHNYWKRGLDETNRNGMQCVTNVKQQKREEKIEAGWCACVCVCGVAHGVHIAVHMHSNQRMLQLAKKKNKTSQDVNDAHNSFIRFLFASHSNRWG